MNKSESIFGGLSKSLIIRIFAKVAGFVRTACAAAFFGFGLQADSLSVALGIAFVFNIFNDSLEFVYARRNEESRKEFDFGIVVVVLSLIAVIGMLYFIFEKSILFSLSAFIASSDYDLLKNSVRLVMSASAIFLISNIYSSFLRTNRYFSLSYSYELVTAVAMLLFTFFLRHNWLGLAWSFFAGQVAGCIFLLFFTHTKFDTTFDVEKLKFAAKEFIQVNYRTMFVSIVSMIFVVGEKFYGDKLDRGGLAIFNLANLLVGIVTSIVPFQQIYSSIYSAKDHEKSIAYYRKFSTGSTCFGILATLLIFVFADDLAALAAGYGKVLPSQISEAGMQMKIISVGIIFTFQNQLIYRYLFLKGFVRQFVWSSMISYVISIGSIFLCYQFGFVDPIVLGAYYLAPAVICFSCVVLLGKTNIWSLYFGRIALKDFGGIVFSGLVGFGIALISKESLSNVPLLMRLAVGGALASIAFGAVLIFVVKNETVLEMSGKVLRRFRT